MCVKIYKPSLGEKTCVQLSSVFLWRACAWMHQRAGEEKKNIGVINDSAARHPSIDSLTPINEGQRCLGFIKVATYEILKWARQQHNVELHMTSHQKRKRRREKRKGGRCEEQKKKNSADSRRGSGNTHISVSETEAAELCRVDIILAEDSLKTGRRTRVWSIYWCQDQVVHYISFNLLRFSIRAKLKCFTSATKGNVTEHWV